ncbi:MAG: hypothetical protein N4A65_01095 [Cohaesibacter sp.]|jgi:hypothetical protein|nr:hypothetical protein [Cohaesibacter sp.]
MRNLNGDPFSDSCSNQGWGMRFTCPGCYADLDYGEWNGQEGECPECHRQIRCYVEEEPFSRCDLVEENDDE